MWLLYCFFPRKPDLAWQYLELGNKIMSALVPHDPAVDVNNLHSIKAIFRAPILSGGLEDDTPIFVVGMPRSGSTLVEQMLASHPQVSCNSICTAVLVSTSETARWSWRRSCSVVVTASRVHEFMYCIRTVYQVTWYKPCPVYQAK